jgi:uncharacterized protein
MTSKMAVTLRTVLFLIACPVILIFAGPLTKTVSPQLGPLLVGTVTSLFTFALTLLFVRWDGIRLGDVGVGFNMRTVPRFLFGFVIGVGVVALQNLVIYAGGHVHWVFDRSRCSVGVVLLLLASYVLLALREEFAFRGYPLFRLEGTWGLWTALVVIGVVFTLEHTAAGWTWSRSLLGPPVGALLFGLAALVTRGLAVPLGIHSAFNFCQWVMGQKEIAGPFKAIVDAGYADRAEALGYGAYVVGMLLAALAFWFWRRRSVGFAGR